MASSISDHSQLSHLHASSVTVDLASSRMSVPTDAYGMETQQVGAYGVKNLR
jgi:hypothetical protein